MTGAGPDPAVLWEPTPERREAARLHAFAEDVRARYGVEVADYEALWRWSVEHVEDFWAAVWQCFDVAPGSTYDEVLPSREMPGARWFPGAQLSFAAHVLRAAAGRGSTAALVAVAEDGTSSEVSWDELVRQVGAAATGLRRLGVQPGDRVVAYLPNVPQADQTAPMLAVARKATTASGTFGR